MHTVQKREYNQVINMPQMALSGLSESWLMKEIGDCHWQMLCKDIGLKSNEIFDEEGNRLYAAFVRITTENSNGLIDYNENDSLDFSGTTQRLGTSLTYSQINITCREKSIKCCLATTFSTREGDSEGESDNSKMTKGIPAGENSGGIIKVSERPKHILDIVKFKKSLIDTHQLSDYNFNITDDIVCESSYVINPYTDMNGVGLLYFAAYPLINDYCEFHYFSNKEGIDFNWPLCTSTMVRDIFYLGNCNVDDSITYKLNSYEFYEDKVSLQSSLYRDSDGTMIAKIFTIKQVTV